MLQLPDDRRPPISPQLAMRVAILGGIALVFFAVIFFRLWFLQVLSGDHYLAQANDNRVRTVVTAAPRGLVVDRNGRTLVDNRVAIVAQIDPDKIPKPGPKRLDLFKRLGAVLNMTPREIGDAMVAERKRTSPFSAATIKTDVSRAVYSYLFERQDQFPGVIVQRAYLREYPYKELAAQLFGTVGEINAQELKEPRFRGVAQGTVVGQGGIESVYDRYLRGKPGATRIQVDALGRPKGELALRQPIQGKQLKLSIDLDLEKAGQQAMAEAGGIPITNGVKNRGGAFVAMDPRNGEVLAMGSYPSFDPNIFSKPVKPKVFNALNSVNNGSPLFDRAIAGQYPTGSTFKMITATAGLESGQITPLDVINDPGEVKISNITFQNAGHAANGAINMTSALRVSSDVYFYLLGAHMNGGKMPLQTWARRFGIGHRTGIDLPGEFPGLLPTPAWRDALFRKKLTDRPWSIGDNVNFAVGQGDLQATPIQMATAYSALANGGRVLTPHLGEQVEDTDGRVLQQIDPGTSRRIDISENTRQTILEGLHEAAQSPGGTSADVFSDFPAEVHGKTGTAERPGQADQSWYVAYAHQGTVDNPVRPIVVAVTVEQGGFGAQAAAPAARLILSQWFGVQKKLVRGSSHTR
jgi:penicillin-binding protein 2